jgi:eukaryotic-like serine/threonine-protein kinase
MSARRWEQLDRIFTEAQQLPHDARTEFIARACGTDEALRAEAMSLLEADAESGEFMVQSALDRLAQAMASEGWSLCTGESIGPYTIQQLLGSGGAGEVWRARDERLGRDVAIKVLLPHYASDADRLRRFAEEARTVGALNHSNILTVYDVGEHHGIPYLVSECLEGRSLRQRLGAGSIPVGEALSIALGVARGLAAAHARAIVHRDLKPENTFLRSDGGVKILDFGLAKLQMSLEGMPAGTSRTMTGVIVGTAGYMAPEQIKSEEVDARADLFALGVMLYEMLAGHHPFRRSSTFETLHAVLTIDPPDVSSLNAPVPTTLGRIVMRLLEKAPDARFQSARDVVWALEQVDTGPTAISAPPVHAGNSMGRWRSRRIVWGAVPVLSALALFTAWSLFSAASRETVGSELTRFTWPLPPGMGLGSPPVVSPDGQRIAFVGIGEKDTTGSRLYVRDRGSLEAVMIPGTEGAKQPFWSPDSTSLGFFAEDRLMKVVWRGGAPVHVADAFFGFGGAWSAAGTIVFGADIILDGLRRVHAGGGRSEPATVLDASRGDTSHCCPVFLPDGLHFLYFVRSANDERRGVYVGRINGPPSGADRPLLRSDSEAVFVPLLGTNTGVLLYVVNGRVEARRFDPARLSLASDALAIAGLSAAGTTLHQPAMLSASTDVLAFAASTVPYGNRIEAADRSGQRLRVWDEPEAQNWPRLSPDGRLLARQRVDGLRNTPDIWVEDLERGTKLRVTTAVEPDIRPVWSSDGRYLAYVSGNTPFRPGTRVLNIAAADGTGVVRTLPCPGEYCEPTDWTARGLLVNVIIERRRDVWIVPTDGGTAAQPLLADAFNERDARMSRNGRWVAYVSLESGRPEVSVRTVSGPPKRFLISGEGGDQPVWRRDDAELFFVDPQGQLRSVPVQWSRDGLPTFGLAAKLNVPPIGRGHWGTPYDVSPDGSRIYFLRRNDDPPPREIHVIIGWRALLD